MNLKASNLHYFIQVLFFLIFILHITSSKVIMECDSPPKPDHGWHDFKPEKSRVNSYIAFGCDEGYELIGEAFLQCGEDGSWLPEIPFCSKIIRCGYPGNGNHCSSNVSEHFSIPGTIATYACEPGYVLIGPSSRICNNLGKWYPEDLPICMVNVAEKRRVFNVSSHIDRSIFRDITEDKGIKIVDGSTHSCSVTKESANKESIWAIDLLEIQTIDILTFLFKDISDIDIHIYYGIQKNGLTKLETSEYAESRNRTNSRGMKMMEMILLEPKELRYLSIRIAPIRRQSLELCEVMMLSKSAISNRMCTAKAYDKVFDVFKVTTELNNGTCYTFAHSTEDTWQFSNRRCKAKFNGSLVSNINTEKNKFILKHLKEIFPGNPQGKSYWIGGYRRGDHQKQSNNKNQWFWIQNNHTIEDFFWGHEQPSSSVSNCLNIAGALDWGWNDASCNERWSFICEHGLMQCGWPDQNEYSVIDHVIQSTDVGATIKYRCLPPYILEGNAERTCEKTGHWSDTPPKCLLKVKEEHSSKFEKTESRGLSAGEIVAIVLGSVAAVIIIIIIVIVFIKKKPSGSKSVKYNKESESTEALDVCSDKTGRINYSSTAEDVRK